MLTCELTVFAVCCRSEQRSRCSRASCFRNLSFVREKLVPELIGYLSGHERARGRAEGLVIDKLFQRRNRADTPGPLDGHSLPRMQD